MYKNPVQQRTLADIIMEKINEKQTELQTQFSDAGSLQVQELDPRYIYNIIKLKKLHVFVYSYSYSKGKLSS